MHTQLVTLDALPFADERDPKWNGIQWPADWVSGLTPTQERDRPVDVCYRLRFTLESDTRLRMHVSADERYDLKLDGVRLGRGPQRGDRRHWSFETFDVNLDAGEHLFWVWVSSPGRDNNLAPSSQLSRKHGLLVAVEGELRDALNTGRAPWESQIVRGVTHLRSPIDSARYAGGTQRFDGRAMNWQALDGTGSGWSAVRTIESARVTEPDWGELDMYRFLSPARLPAMMDEPFAGGTVRHVAESASPISSAEHHQPEAEHWQALLDQAKVITVPPHTRRVVLIDWMDYVCAYPTVRLRSGRDAEVRLDWAEALHTRPESWCVAKQHRDAVAGLYFNGRGDTFINDGQLREFTPLWWRAGRYTLLTLTTQDEPLDILGLGLRETRYPLDTLPLPEFDDGKIQAALPILERGLLMSMHEHYADSPYYEQLMYVGDTRLESLCTHVRSADDRLPMRAIELFGWSRIESGLTQARYPSSTPQIIPSFSLYWVAMLHDLARWRPRKEFVGSFMPAARSVTEAFLECLEKQGKAEGVLRSLPGWNFLDWVPAWDEGIPPGGLGGHNAAFAWQFVYTLRLKAELEDWFDQSELANRDRRYADTIATACDRVFFDDSRGLYADDPHHTSFSQHAQCFAVLSGLLPIERSRALVDRMLADDSLHAATIYFHHYLFETLAATGHVNELHRRLDLWRALPDLGFKCPPEAPEPTRSDCHGWGSHPLYRLVETVLGVRPAPAPASKHAFGFTHVEIAPALGPMRFARGEVPHPQGVISVDLTRNGQTLDATIELPPGLHGQLRWNSQARELTPGRQRLQL